MKPLNKKRPKHPYVTIEELRKNPDLLAFLPKEGDDPRFGGGTDPQIAIKYCSKTEPILECGALFGRFTQLLQENGYSNIHVVDLVKMLYFPDVKKLTFHEVDLNKEKLPYTDNFFGSACVWGLCEHLENPFHFIREIHRVLKDDGIFICSMPNVTHIMSRLGFLFTGMLPRWNQKNNHITLFPKGVFEKTFLRHFDLVETRYLRPNLRLFSNNPKKYLPANQWFGNYVIYILRRKKFEPYA